MEIFQKGDRILYLLGAAPHRERWLPGVVINITPKRVVVRLDGHDSHRNTLPQFVKRDPSHGNHTA